MARKPPSARAQARAALQELYKPATYSGLRDLADMGKLDMREVRKYYTDARAIAVKRVSRIQESNIPYVDKPPEFRKTSELSDEDLLKAVGAVNKFLRGPTKVSERRQAYGKLIDDLHSKGLTFVTVENLPDWDRFRKWIKAKGILNLPYMDGSVVADIFKQAGKEGQQNSARWNELYNEFKTLLRRKPKTRRRHRRT